MHMPAEGAGARAAAPMSDELRDQTQLQHVETLHGAGSLAAQPVAGRRSPAQA